MSTSVALAAEPTATKAAIEAMADIIDADENRADEHFIPVTRTALADRLTQTEAWADGQAAAARRFFRFLDYWRQQRYAADLTRLQQAYEPFSPDSDLFVTRHFTDAERAELQRQVIQGVGKLLQQANYTEVRRDSIEKLILTRESHYGLDLKVDFQVFEELLIFYRGASVRKESRRRLSGFGRKEEFEVPIFRRVFVLFKLKPLARHIADVAKEMSISEEEAAKYVNKLRRHIPDQISDGNIYMKLFKNLPRSDIEMIFPNTEVKFRVHDKVWLGVSGGGAVGAGLYGAAGKLAVALAHPLAAVGALGGIGMVLFRQIMNVMNQKQRYMTVLAQNLYFHAMADNRGVMSKLADRAAEEDFKEEILLYAVLAKAAVTRADLEVVDEGIERYIANTFGLDVDFDVSDALERLIKDGIVSEGADGVLRALPPTEAARHIDAMWDRLLDDLTDMEPVFGTEIQRPPTVQSGT